MKKLLIGAIALLGAAVAPANLVVNGDFEVPQTLDAASTGFIVVATGDNTSISGWTSGGRFGDISVDIVSSIGFPSYPAYTGTQMIDLAGTPGPGAINQDVATSIGTKYILTFATSSNGGPNALEVYWEGVLLDTVATPTLGTWTTHSYVVTASTTASNLMFGSVAGGNQGALLDTVSLDVVPEPATMTLLLGSVAALLRRRAKR
jgi:hypothetical protein